jgi:hypothetical protein
MLSLADLLDPLTGNINLGRLERTVHAVYRSAVLDAGI